MSAPSSPEQPDLAELRRGLDRGARRLEALSVELSDAPTPEPGAGEELIASVAENLSTMRRVSRLPDREPAQFRDSIMRHQDPS